MPPLRTIMMIRKMMMVAMMMIVMMITMMTRQDGSHLPQPDQLSLLRLLERVHNLLWV